jgi:hypothetical protein
MLVVEDLTEIKGFHGGNLTGKALSAKIAIEAIPGTTFMYFNNDGTGTLQGGWADPGGFVRLYFNKVNTEGCPTGWHPERPDCEAQYWWSNPLYIDLPDLAALGKKGIKLEVRLDPEFWSDRDGHMGNTPQENICWDAYASISAGCMDVDHVAAFNAAVANVKKVGLSFGGNGWWAFGCGASAPGAMFKLNSFEVKKVHSVQADGSVVFVDNLQPSWTAPGGGGVFAAYVGPPDYGYVSPGATAVYLGREAGIIKAGLAPDPDDGHYWDEGLFAFKPNVTIDKFADGTLTYDVVNQFGENPVWMTIEIDTWVVGDRADNTTYQFVPTSNDPFWHTVDAADGLWQKWNNNMGDVTGNPEISLSGVAAAHTGLDVVRAYLRLGMGDSYHGIDGLGTVAWVDKATLGGVTYDFVTDLVVASKDECKNGGWKTLVRVNGTSFKNQGDCIQYVNTGK